MDKQEFAFRLMTFFIPYPLSKMLPRLLRRLFRGPSVETPGIWAAAAFDALQKLYDDTAAAAESLIGAAEKLTPTDQLTDLISSLENALDTASNLIDLLKNIIVNLTEYTLDEIINAFNDTLPALDDLTSSIDGLAGYLPPAIIPPPPLYIPPVCPIYIGPPAPGPGGSYSHGRVLRGLRAVWFDEEFNVIDPAVWTDFSSGTGVCSIFENQLKMLSNGAGDYAYLRAANDPSLPDTFIWDFFLTVLSGNGKFNLGIKTGVHEIWLRFEPPDTLSFRQKNPLGYKSIDVGNYMTHKKWWRIHYNGDTCDIYWGYNLIDSELTVYESASNKGRRWMSCDDILSLYLDNFRIIYPV